jgi:hypothetical protein
MRGFLTTREAAAHHWGCIVEQLRLASPEGDVARTVLTALDAAAPDWLSGFTPLGLDGDALVIGTSIAFCKVALEDLFGQEIHHYLAALPHPQSPRRLVVQLVPAQ